MIEHSQKKQAGAYRRFVGSGLSDIDAAFIADMRRSRLCIGSDDCRVRTKGIYRKRIEGYRCGEDVSFRREAYVIPAEEVLATVSRVLGISEVELQRRSYKSYARPLTAKVLCQYSGLNQREVAALLGLSSGADVCQQIRRLDHQLQRDRFVKKILQQIDNELKAMTRQTM